MTPATEKRGGDDSSPLQTSLQADQIQEVVSRSDLEPSKEDSSTHGSPPSSALRYTVFSPSHRRLITLILILTMLASPLTATIYLPLLPLLVDHFHVSLQAINITLTLYIVFQALSPLLFATASNTFGRRPIYLVIFSLYTLASLGLVLNRTSYAGLLVLRALQSLGASAVLAIAYGVVADLCVPSERGAMQGPAMGAANLAVCIGPVVGGLDSLREWELRVGLLVLGDLRRIGVSCCGACFAGDGEECGWKRRDRGEMVGKALVEINPSLAEKSKKIDGWYNRELTSQSFRISNPLAAIRIIFWRDTALVLWMAGSPYAVWYCVQASIPPIYRDIYGFNEFQIGLSYLTGGFGTVLGGYANGKFMDWNYRVTARQIGHTVDKISGDDLNHFPIERARARGSWCLLGIYICALAGYGWAIRFEAHESVPLILQFVLAAICTAFQQTFNALLVDIFPASPSTAAASGYVTRCLLSAVAVAVLQPMIDGMGRGWYFTSLSMLSGGGGIVANWFVTTRGMAWRHQRLRISEAV
ncbi:MAG: hypothetical protein Q9200_002096 [Gallowayella weberi]